MALIPMFSFGQSLRFIPRQSIIEEAVKNGFFITQQSFQIRDKESGELFGLNGKPEFGVKYSLGLKTPDGIIMSERAIRPWEYDEKFKKYAEKYDPVFYQAKYTELGEKVKYDSLTYSHEDLVEMIDSSLYCLPSNIFTSQGFLLDGFVLDVEEGDKQGWIVWLTTKSGNSLDKSADLTFTIYRKDFKVEKRNQSFDIDDPTPGQNPVGGAYVVPYMVRPGVVEFRLCGIILKKNDNWKIFTPFVGMNNEDSSEQEPVNEEILEQDDSSSELTPVKTKEEKKDKKKKRK